MTLAQHDAERLVEALGRLFGLSVTIAWEPGLGDELGLLGYCGRDDPGRLHVDPDQAPAQLLATVAHEFLHSLEYRDVVERAHRRRPSGSMCSALAARVGPEIAALAMRSPSGVPSRAALATLLFARLGVMPRPLAATARGTR